MSYNTNIINSKFLERSFKIMTVSKKKPVSKLVSKKKKPISKKK